MTRTLVNANGASIPALGLGTWQLRDEECARAVAQALKVGYRHLDTAAMYGNEEAVGEGLRASGVPREEVFVTTKVWHTDLAPGDLERSAEASLRRLGLSEVDLLLIHWPPQDGVLDGAIPALCAAKRAGLTRQVGVSNFTVGLLERAVLLAGEPLAANQCEYHPYLDQAAVLASCRRHGITLTSYCPLGKGELLADPVVVRIAQAHGRTPAQVVLRWHVQQPGVAAIPKSGNPARIAENAGVFDFRLAEEDMAHLHALARPGGRMVRTDFEPEWDHAA